MSNTYYNAKSQREEDPAEALESFEMLLEMEEEKGSWGFKALKQIIKLLYKQKKFDKLSEKYKQLLGYMSVISRNDMEKAINNVLNIMSNDTSNIKISEKIYSITINSLKNDTANDRLWFNTKIKLGSLYCDMNDLKKLSEIITELKKWCLGEDGTEDKKKSGFLLDIYVLEIQMYTVQNDRKRLKDLYDRCMQILSGAVVLNPRSTGIIRECGGKMRMRDRDYKEAYGDFFEAFKSYDDAGNVKRIRCLRYLVLASMLLSKEGEIEVNPFEASEVKPYKSHVDIEPMTLLISHFQKSRLNEFERVLKKHKDIMQEEFIKDFIPDLFKTFRSKILLQMIKPYTRINFKFIANELNIEEVQVEDLCVDLILDSRLDGQIDQMNSRLNLGRKGTDVTRYKSTAKWATKLGDIHGALLNKVN